MSWNGPPSYGGAPLPTDAATHARKARVRRRTWWLVGTMPLVVVLVVLGVRLTFLAPIASSAKDDYDASDYQGAETSYEGQKTMNIVDPWKAHYNAGTAGAATQDSWALYDATSSLHTAYELAHDESPEVRCMIQTNLSLTYELTGDSDLAYSQDAAAELEAVEDALAAREAGQDYDESVLDPDGDGTEVDPDELRATADDYAQYAQQEFATAEQIRGWPDCAQSEQTPEQEEQDEAAVQRLQDKQQQAEDARPPEEGEGDPQEGEGGESEDDGGESEEPQTEAEREEQERQEKLDEQNSDAQDEQEELEQEYNNLYGDEPGSGGESGDDSGGGGTKNW
ncbi:hypothetical protein [Cellulosimicrobium arenosum]|uniref:MNN4 protein n=1 Tax=Cellulosimicrobium arenosum TaxID=2708133 RepID=A0A927J1X5_9MICO|nr:hypothetical protein [Cellulosimicrobium arenosum]MBD8080337.1 hypothetical protein [Cellulosimicrobium arenosum]